jgi:hypothetical protein
MANEACIAIETSTMMTPIRLTQGLHGKVMVLFCRCWTTNCMHPELPPPLPTATRNSHGYYFRFRVKLLSSDMALLL